MMTITTPAVLFPALSLILLANTNRFLALSSRIRDLHAKYQLSQDELLKTQIKNLRQRVFLIKNMQLFGVFSMLLCVVCTLLIFAGYEPIAAYIFVTSLLFLMVSLLLSLLEIQISMGALGVLLKDMEAERSVRISASHGERVEEEY